MAETEQFDEFFGEFERLNEFFNSIENPQTKLVFQKPPYYNIT